MSTKSLKCFYEETADEEHPVHQLPGLHPTRVRHQMGDDWTTFGQARYCLQQLHQICPGLELGERLDPDYFTRMGSTDA